MSLRQKTYQKIKGRNIKKAIPYEYIYDDGMFETSEGNFSKAFMLGEVNFQTASDEEQERIFYAYEDLLKAVEDNASFQIVIHNMRENSKMDLLAKVMYKPLRDQLNDYRQWMNALISDRLRTGRNGLKQLKYAVLSIKETDTLRAQTILDNSMKNLIAQAGRISPRMKTENMTSEERLRSLFNIYNQDNENVFDNARRKDGTTMFSFRQMAKQGRTTKDEISPSGMQIDANSFRIGRAYARSFFLNSLPPGGRFSAEYLQEIANINCPSLISVHCESVPIAKILKLAKNKITALDGEVESRHGNSSESIKNARSAAVDLMDDIVNHKQKTMYVTVCVTVFAESMKQLDDYTKQIQSIGTNRQAPLITAFAQQLECFNSCLPLGRVYIDEHKLLTTESAAIFLPFTSLELEQLHGYNYGTNEVSKNQIFLNRLSNKNYNALVFGKSGSGKSAYVKLEALQALLRSTKNYVHIIDPHGEYVKFAKKLHGTVITFGAKSNTCLNPMDLDITFDSDEDPLTVKSEYILGLFEIIQHGTPLLPTEASILDRCVRSIYRGYIEHMEARHNLDPSVTRDRDEEALPTLRDLYYELLHQNDRDAQNLAKTIEMYAVGGMHMFSNRTNIDTNNRLIVYDIHRLGSGTKDLGLYVCINELKNAAIENKKNGDWTYMYIDEMQSVLGSDTSTKPLSNIWASVRKFNGIPTGILQNTNNILAAVEGRNILNNSTIMTILDSGSTDRANLADYLHLSDTEVECVNNAKSGSGLLCVGSLRIPFNNRLDKDKYPELYDLIDTTETTEIN